MNGTSPPTNVRKWQSPVRRLKLRDRLFLASALISTAILLIAAWVISNQVVNQARQQVRSEIEALLPVYDAVWEEKARHLAVPGQMIADSPSARIIFGDARASRDRATIREMIADFGGEQIAAADLVMVTDGGGSLIFAEMRGHEAPLPDVIEVARVVAETQQPRQGFVMIGEQLFQLALTPTLVQSGNSEYQNTLAVVGTGLELNHSVAQEIRNRTHNDVIFMAGSRLCASSLDAQNEGDAIELIARPEIGRADAGHPLEVRVGDHLHLAFARQLTGFDGQHIGQIVMLRSLAEAGEMFRSLSRRLLLLWTLSIAVAFLLSYLIARRITKPMEALVAGTREYGQGNYDYEIRAAAQGELGELAGAFDQMRRSLRQTQSELLRRERLATVGRMVSSIIHDLRNPLATIATAAEMLHRENLAPDRRHKLIESQLRAARRLQDMLQELLDFTQGNHRLNLARHPLAMIVERAVQEVSTLAARAGVQIETDIPPDLFVCADVEPLRRVFENLLLNAIQAMSAGGEVRITAGRQERQARITVADDGPGVPAEIQERIFEPFVSHGKLGGTGLGLAIAHSVIEAHAGSISLAANTARGAMFEILMPLEKDTGGCNADQSFAG